MASTLKYRCPVVGCQETFYCTGDLRLHLPTHGTDKHRVHCPECETEYDNEVTLRNYTTKILFEGKSPCTCSSQQDFKIALKELDKTNPPPGIFATWCDNGCGKWFVSRKQKNKHMTNSYKNMKQATAEPAAVTKKKKKPTATKKKPTATKKASVSSTEAKDAPKKSSPRRKNSKRRKVSLSPQEEMELAFPDVKGGYDLSDCDNMEGVQTDSSSEALDFGP